MIARPKFVSARYVTLALVTAAVAWLVPARAEACGGFFCSFNAQVNQAAERILFAVEGTTATAHIQINYQGSADDFSWVLPLPSVPEVEVGTDLLFGALHAATDPRFFVEWERNPDCDAQAGCQYDLMGAVDEDGALPPSAPADPNVEIFAEGEVGPFNYKVVGSDDAQALFDWLNENGYDQPEAAKPLIEHYVEINHVFVALKLLKDKEAGEIRPVVLTYEAPALACIPIRLTQIAANADMPVYTWVLAGARAIPLNFFHVVLNARKYPWLQCGSHTGEVGYWGWYQGNADCSTAYLDLVSEAADSASGRGFVTEYAGASSIMDDRVHRDGQLDTEGLASIAEPARFLSEMLSRGFPRDATMQNLIRRFIPQPDASDLPEECRQERDFYNFNLESCLAHMDPEWVFEPQAFVDAIEEEIVQPLRDAQAMFSKHAYLTRMFTTMSPDEMTRDPIFSFNPDLGEVAHEHTVKARFECREGTTDEPESITLTFPDGATESVPAEMPNDGCGPVVLDDDGLEAMPAAAAVQIVGEEGAPETVAAGEVADQDTAFDRVPMPSVDRATATPNENTTVDPGSSGTFASTPADGDGDGTPATTTEPDRVPVKSGCAAGPSPHGLGALLLILFAAAGTRRRFRRTV